MGLGEEVEKQARLLAGILGVPDFVYQTPDVHNGGETWEPADGLLVNGDEGLIIEVKTRDQPNDSFSNCQVWVKTRTKKGFGQIAKTRERFAAGEVVESIPLRGPGLRVAGSRRWPALIVLAIDNPPKGLKCGTAPNTVVMTSQDFFQLQRYVPSTYWIIQYVKYAAQLPAPEELGREQDRYTCLALRGKDQASAKHGAYSLFPEKPIRPADDLDGDYVKRLINRVHDVTEAQPKPDWACAHTLMERLDRIGLEFHQRLEDEVNALYRDARSSRRVQSQPIITNHDVAAIYILAGTKHSYRDQNDLRRELHKLCQLRLEEFNRDKEEPTPVLGIGIWASAPDPLEEAQVLLVEESTLVPAERWMLLERFGDRSGVYAGPPDHQDPMKPCLCGSGARAMFCHPRPLGSWS